MHIRSYLPGEEAQLHAIFHSAVHGLAWRHYTAEQLHAWAPHDYDCALWAQRMRANQSLVVELDGQPAAGVHRVVTELDGVDLMPQAGDLIPVSVDSRPDRQW